MEEQLMRFGKSKETIETAKAELLEKFNDYGSVVQKECEERIQLNKQRYKEKKEKLVEKIMSQKSKIDQFEQLRGKDLTVISIGQYEDTIQTLTEDIKKVKQEWENKLYYEDLEFQKKLAESSSKHKHEIDNMQESFQKAYEDKVTELEQDFEQQISNSKEEIMELSQACEELQAEIMDLKDKNDLLKNIENEKNIEIQEVTEKIQEKLSQKIDEIQEDLNQAKEMNHNLSLELDNKNNSLKELCGKLEDYERKIEELEQRNRNLLQENGSVKSQLQDDYKVKNLENKIRENMALQDQNDQLKGIFKRIKNIIEKEVKLLADIETYKELNKDLEAFRKEAVQ